MNKTPPRAVLLIAYHYPPCASSSGVQRTLSFSRHLSKYGWKPIVLSVAPGSYERCSIEQLRAIPDDVPVARTFALDSARHLAIRGRHWSRLAAPDRWRAWWLTAVPCGLRLIRRHAIDAIWSTYPIATAHSIAASLARMAMLPWVADFRDPMVEHIRETNELFPRDPALRRARLRIESTVAERASRLVFCTNAARRIVADRYPTIPAQHLRVISNGFDEDAFLEAEALPPVPRTDHRRVLLHSGTIYPGPDRDPTALMQALKALADDRLITPENFELRLRDPSNEDYFRRLAHDLEVSDFVKILPAISYREALAEMLGADGLLVLQGFTSNPAIPAKVYEYLRAAKPVIGLVHPDGETAATLRSLGIETLAPLTSVESIQRLLTRWLNSAEAMQSELPDPGRVAVYSRRGTTLQLATLLDELTTGAA